MWPRRFLAGLVAGWILTNGSAPCLQSPRHPLWAAAPETPAKLASRVRMLTRQLDDPRVAIRDQAEHQLDQLGPKILPLLPAATDRLSAEVKHRLARVRRKLEQARANAVLQPARVTARAGTMTLAELLAAIQKQTGNKLHVDRARGAAPVRVTLGKPLAGAPFWPTLDRILDQAHRTTYPFSQTQTLNIVPAPPDALPRCGRACYVGPFRVEAIRVDAHQQLRVPKRRGLDVTIEIAWEPRLRPIGLSQPLRDVRAFADQDRPIPPIDAAMELTPSVPDGTTAVQFQLPLALPPRAVARIVRCEGTLTALVPAAVEAFRFAHVDQQAPQEHRKGSAVVVVDKVRKNRDLWEVRVRVRYDRAGDAFASHRGWIFGNPCYFEAADGKRIEYVGMETTLQTKAAVGLAYLFDLPAGPQGLTFIYQTPVAIFQVPVHYVLSDIPLP